MAQVIIEYEEYQELLKIKNKEGELREGVAWEVVRALIKEHIQVGRRDYGTDVHKRVQDYLNEIINYTGYKIQINSIGGIAIYKQ